MADANPRAPKINIRPAGESAIPVWHVVAPKGHTIEDALAPGYLAERISNIASGAIVLITSAAHSFLVEVYIRAVDKDAQAFETLPLRVVDLREMEVLAEDWSTATITNAGHPHGWCVRLGNRIARSNFPSERDAHAFVTAKAALARGGKASLS